MAELKGKDAPQEFNLEFKWLIISRNNILNFLLKKN